MRGYVIYGRADNDMKSLQTDENGNHSSMNSLRKHHHKHVIRTLIVDDSPLARAALHHMIMNYPGMSEPKEAETIKEAAYWCDRMQFDIVFFDVMLPDGSGIDSCSIIPSNVALVYISAYEDYATPTIKNKSLDYLLKPIRRKDFEECIKKYKAWKLDADNHLCSSFEPQTDIKPDAGEIVEGFAKREICAITSRNRGTLIVLPDGRTVVHQKSLAVWHKKLASPDFLRVHRGVIINISHVEQIIRQKNRTVLITVRGLNQPVTSSIRLAPRIVKALKQRHVFSQACLPVLEDTTEL